MSTFYPGPSKLHPQVRQYLLDAYDSGILSANHRSRPFMDLCARTLALLHQKLDLPAGYTVVFVSSATECWEVIAQSFAGTGGLHLYNGAFGQKWHEYTRKLKPAATGMAFDLAADPMEWLDRLQPPGEEPLCLTHNETSNGTQLPAAFLEAVRRRHPDALLAVDATSSMGGAHLPFAAADLWFASVQKCFGLPAGLALLVASPRAQAAARRLADDRHYNSYGFMHDNIRQLQTHLTPNVLGIYLLMRVLESMEEAGRTALRLHGQAAEWYAFLEAHPVLRPLVPLAAVRSDTVVAVAASEAVIGAVKEGARQAGITVGNGYGPWRHNTLRIANFPAITPAEIEALRAVLANTF